MLFSPTLLKNLTGVLLSFSALSLPLLAAEAPTPNTEIVIEVAQDGSGPFDLFRFFNFPPFFEFIDDDSVDGGGAHTPGLDAPNLDNGDPSITIFPAELNGVVRTFDTVRYNVHWNVNDVDSAASNDGVDGIASNVVITLSTGREDVSWKDIPGRCKTSGVVPVSSIVDNGATGDLLTCNLGDVAEGTAGTISPIADVALRADGAPSDGGLIPMTATIDTDQSALVTSNEVNTTISGAPAGDWIKSPAEYIPGVFNGGIEGGLLIYPLSFKPFGPSSAISPGEIAAPGRGSDVFDDTLAIQFFDHAWDLTPSAVIATPAMAAAVGRDICGGYDGAGGLPYGDDGSLPAGAADGIDNETNPFAITCTLDGASAAAGYPIVQVDITGQDTTSSPTKNVDGNPNLDKIVVAAQIAFWAPLTELQAKFDLGGGNNLLWNTITMSNALDTDVGGGSFVLATENIELGVGSGLDETTIMNNTVNGPVDPVLGPVPTGGSFAYRHTGRFYPGPYQEMFFPHDDGLERMGIDTRLTTLGGLGPIIDGDLPDYGWHGTGEVSRNEIVTLHARVVGSSDGGLPRDEPIHLCTAIDNAHIEIIDFPSNFQRFETDYPIFLGGTGLGGAPDEGVSVSSNTGSASDGIAHVLLGDATSNIGSQGLIDPFSNPWTRINPLTTPDYVVQVTDADLVASYPLDQHELGCDDSDAGGSGWVDTDGDLSAFVTGTDTDGNTVYGGISRIRVLMLEPRSWENGGTDANTYGVETSTIILNMQARVKPTIADAGDGDLMRIHTARGQGAIDIDNVAVLSANCTNDDVFAPGLLEASWCSLPYDLLNEAAAPADQQIDTRAIERLFVSDPDTIQASHSDRLVVVSADLGITKTNISGPTDLIINGDLVTFSIATNIVGSPQEQFGNLFVEDRIDLNPNFEFVSQTDPVDAGGAALTNFTCTDAFGGVQDSLRCDFTSGAFDAADPNTFRISPFFATWTITVRAIGAPGNFAIPNEAVVSGDLDQPGVGPLPVTKSAFAFAYTGPAYNELFIRKDVPDLSGVCTDDPGAAELADSTLIAGDCSVFAVNGQYQYDMIFENKGSADLANVVIIDTFPFVGDSAEPAAGFEGTPAGSNVGDGRTPESAFSGTSVLVTAVPSNGLLECTTAAPATINRDPALDLSVWTAVCDATSTGFKLTLDALPLGGVETLAMTLQTAGNVDDDIYTNNIGARTDTILVPARSNDVSAMVQGVSIGSIIWSDSNSDGLQTAGEPGIEGATVTLLNGDGTVYDSDPSTPAIEPLEVVTGADGLYFFEDLPEGDYQVQVEMPGNYVPTINQQTGDDDDTADDSNIATSAPGQIHTSGTFTLSIGGEPDGVDSPIAGSDAADDDSDSNGNMTVDFGFLPFVSLGSNVWLDTDLDGVQDAGEVPIEGATMTLLNSDGTVYDSDPSTPAIDTLTAITDANGQYFFNDLIEGDYIVQLDASTSTSHPGQLLPTPPQMALPNNDSNTDSNIDILNAGHDPVAELYFSGVVTLEAGTEPAAELNPLTSTADQPGQTAAQPDANGNMTVDFGLVEYVSVGSTVWIDSDGNGLQDAGEPPIVGAMVTLMNADGLTAYDSDPTTAAIEPLTVFTDPDGQYNFNQLPPGTYRVQVDLGTVLGGAALVPTPIQVDDPENDDNTDSNIDVNAVGAVPALQIYQSGPITLLVGDEPAGETDPIGAGGADQPNQTAVDLDDSGNMTVDFGFVKPMSIGSYVWEDTSLDGFQDPGEPGINGATVNLLVEDPATPGTFIPAVNLDGDPVPATTTANDGTDDGVYLFDNLPPGNYKVQVSAIPAGFVPSGTQTTGDDDDTDNDSNIASEPVTGTFESGEFALVVDNEPLAVVETQAGDSQDDTDADSEANGNMTIDFGFVPTVSIGSFVWEDNGSDGASGTIPANIANGIQDADEPAIEGATVSLLVDDGTGTGTFIPATDANGGAVADQLTLADGLYYFDNLPEGVYKVQVTPPAQFVPTLVQNTTDDDDTDNDSNIASEPVVDTTYESGEFTLELGTEPDTADEGEAGDDQDDLVETGGNMTVDFGFIQPVSIGSYVWQDTNGNGLQDAGEPAVTAGTVSLVDANGDPVNDIDGNPVTDIDLAVNADGLYFFDNLVPGDYKVQVTPLDPEYVPTPPQNTADDSTQNDSNIASEPTAGTYESPVITLMGGDELVETAGEAGDDQDDASAESDASGDMTIDFGFVKPLSIGSYVWEDSNGDGTQDAAEAGINDVTVSLLVEDPASPGDFIPAVDLDGAAVADVTTANDGTDDGVYLFDNLPPGNYKVQVTDLPDGFIPSGTQTTADDDDADADSNIADEPDPGVFESGVFTLEVDGEPLSGDEGQPGDAQDDSDPADGSTESNGNMTIDFGFVQPVSIGSYVWEDNGADGAGGTTAANVANGIQDADEPPLEGALIALLVDDGTGTETFVPASDIDGVLVADQTTLADGLYFFDNLPEGIYKVQVTPPAPFKPTLVQNDVDDDDTANDSNIALETATLGTYESGMFTLEYGEEPDAAAETEAGDDQDDDAIADEIAGNMTVDFGFIQPVSIGSYVWEDTNGNGLQDAGEPAITEGTVTLVDAAGLAVTDLDGNPVLPIDLAVLADGQYLFDNLAPGIYKVQVTPLDPDYVPSPIQSTADDDVQNDSNIASAPTPDVTYESPLITLTAGLELVETAGEVGDDLDDAAIAEDDAGNMTVDFGFVKPMSIGSYVWEDTNGDGTQDAAEVGISDVTVSLLVEDPASPGDFIPAVDLDGVTVADVTTGNDGTDDGVYLFDNLPPGNYKVQVTDLPDGFMPSNTQTAGDDDVDDDSNIATEPTPGVVFESGIIALGVDEEPLSDDEGQPGDAQDDSDPADGNTESNGNMTIDFGFFQIVSIGSYVWEDLDVDGVQDDTEPAIEGAEVVLLVEDAANPGTFIPAVDIDGVAVDPQTTDVDGLYYFDMLPEGTYKVQVTPPAIFVPTLVQTDGDDADTTPADELDSNIADEPVAGTYESGAFELMAGDEPTESGDATGDDQDDDMETSGNMTVDFGFIQPVSIGSYVWEDTNGDGLQDATEPAITAGTVELFNADGTPVTDLDGNLVGPVDLSTTGGLYIFDNLVPGDYKVRVTPEDTTLLISPNQEPGDDDTENDSNIDVDSGAPDGSFESGVFTLTPGTEPTEGAEVGDDQDDDGTGIAAEDAGNMTVDFGFVQPVSLGSTVFFDNNNNGVQDDTDAGIPGVTVTLYEADGETPVAGVDPVLTDDDGNYFFDGLLPGDYVVGVMAPTDAPTSSDGAGGDDQTDSDDNGIQDAPGDETLSEVITLLAGDEPEGDDEDGQGGDQDDDAIATDDAGDMTIDFGFVPPVSIGSTVFFDNDDNGMQGDDETGIPGVTVTLYQEVNGVLEPVPDVPPVVTDDEGNYLFEDLLPGIYVVGVIPLDHSPTSSTSDGSDDQVDSDDNGIQTASGDEAFSSPIDLEAGTEPEGESGQGGDQDADADDAGDMSVDFGFVPLPSDISLIKTRTDGYPIDLGDGSWRVRFDFEVENTGEVELTEVQIVDDLIAMLNSNAINDGVISEVELESPDMTLSPSPSYDGVGDTNMLDGTDVMSVGEIGHLQLTFKFTAAQFFGPFMNMGDVTGMPPNRVPEEDEDDAVVEVFDTEKPITLGWFSSSDQGNGEVIFEWSTQTEIGNVGYYLWSRAEGGQWSQLNEDMIVSQGDSLEEQVYQYRAFTAGDAFRLTDVSMSGKEVHHGPYQLGEQAGVRIERHPTDWDSIQRQSDEKQRAREQQRRDEMQRRLQQLQGSIDHKPALGLMSKAGLVMANLAGALISPAHALEMANFDVDAAGVYRVTHAQLVAAGLDLEGYASNRIGLKMANALAPLKILPLSSDTFGAGSSIEFPALGVDTLYAGSNVYTLVLDEGQNLIQADERTIPSGPPAYSYMAEVVHAPQNVYAHFSPDESDAWYAYRMDALNNNSASKSVSLSVTDHALAFHTSGATSDSRQIASKKPRLEVKLWGASTLAGDGEAEPDHHVTVSINGGEVADERFDGIRKHVLSKPLAQINSGSNTIKVDLPNDHSYPFDRVDIDSVKLLYPRQFKADDSGRSLVFPSSWNKFLLQKLSSTDVVVYRLDSDGNADQMMQHEGNCDAGAGNCIVSFAGVMSEADDSAVYFVSTEAGIKQPQIAMAPPHEALFDGEAKMLVIAHPDFIGTSLSTLEGYTASMAGIYGSSDLVNVESIYAQYSGQVMDANAVHQYIIDAVATRGTEHVMLVGGDMYDYRNNLGTSAKSFVPSLYIQTGQNQSTVPSDPKYADVDGDDIPDIDIARLPVRTEAELEVLLSKRQSYLSRSYTGSAVFSADKTDETGNDFDVTSEQWVSDYFSGWNVDRAYIDNMGSGAKQVVRDGINAGASLTSYTGHSSTVSWSFDDLFNSDDVSALTNAGKPTVVAQWGCWNTFYSSPEQESIAQKFLVEGDKGAVVVMGATSLGGADTEDAMADLLYARLSQGMRIGDAVLSAKRAFAEAFPGRLDMLLGWTVLGPADLTVN